MTEERSTEEKKEGWQGSEGELGWAGMWAVIDVFVSASKGIPLQLISFGTSPEDWKLTHGEGFKDQPYI